jgi:hypothetical protein
MPRSSMSELSSLIWQRCLETMKSAIHIVDHTDTDTAAAESHFCARGSARQSQLVYIRHGLMVFDITVESRVADQVSLFSHQSEQA